MASTFISSNPLSSENKSLSRGNESSLESILVTGKFNLEDDEETTKDNEAKYRNNS